MLQCRKDQRAAWRSWFSPPTRCILGTELIWLGSMGFFPVEPSG